MVKRFADTLNQVQHTGAYYASGDIEMHAIRLDVTGVGTIALPLLDVLEAMNPSSLEFNEATGNAGASFDRLYALAALVVWPRKRYMNVIAQSGIVASIGFLGEMCKEWQNSGREVDSPIRIEAQQLSKHIIEQWPTDKSSYTAKFSIESNDFMAHLISFEDLKQLDKFLSKCITEVSYTSANTPVLLQCLTKFSQAYAKEIVTAILVAHSEKQLAACANLLYRVVKLFDRNDLQPAADHLINTIASPTAQESRYHQRINADASLESVLEVLPALEVMDSALAKQAATLFLEQSKKYPMDDILLPAMLRLYQGDASRNLPSVCQLREQVLIHLKQRIAKPLASPENWTRENKMTCRCDNCQSVAAFLIDPKLSTYHYKAAEAKRSHLQTSSHKCDLDFSTEKKSRPYVLICRKNKASYQKLYQQRSLDLKDLASLEDQ
ncbi:MAG: hypothetical protein Q9M28_04310 [Mariprofundaceae bacterium]|nr:hypothetical protein [Mariprofundaceae bacterium]